MAHLYEIILIWLLKHIIKHSFSICSIHHIVTLLTVIICNIILIYQLNTRLKKSNNITKYSISKVKNRKKATQQRQMMKIQFP